MSAAERYELDLNAQKWHIIQVLPGFQCCFLLRLLNNAVVKLLL